MTSEMTAIGIAICTTSLVCLVLIQRSQRRPANRQASYDNSGSDGGTHGENGILFGGDGHHSASDHSTDASDSSVSGDSGAGDGGGGGGGSSD